MKRSRAAFFGVALWVAAAVAAGCSGGTVVPAPQRTSGPGGAPTASHSATPGPSASATPTPTASGPLNAAAMNVRMTDVQTFYQTLPHTSVSADIASVAAHMSSSDGFKNVTVSPGGIGANFSDGTPAFIFTDREEDVGGGSSAMSSARQAARGHRFGIPVGASPSPVPTGPPPNTTLGPGAAHVIDFVVNTGDTRAFTPSRQYELGSAFVGDGFTAANGYEVDVLNVTLENITGLGSSHPLDLFSIATHGAVDLNPQPRYVWFSQTPVADTSLQTYAADLAANRVAVSVYLGIGESDELSAFAFTPDFVAEHAQFNPGAIVDNESCFGQSPSTAAAVAATLQAAGAGRYYGWTKTVLADDADGFDIFLYDRLIGVGSQPMVQSGLEQMVFRDYAANAAPVQRPFPLDAVDAVAYTEPHGASLSDSGGTVPFAVSDNGDVYNAPFPPVSDGTASKLVITDFGGESVAHPPIEYALPSIRDLQMKEDQLGGELEIDGAFPATQGTVSIVNAVGTFTPLIYSWSTSKIFVRTALEGAGANGLVTVTAAGITSNAVQLTQWEGTFTYSEADTIPTLATYEGASVPYALPGSGSGSVRAPFSIGVRADVHPIAPSIDTAPEAQNLVFSTFEADSSATINAVSGSFAASNSEYGMQTFSLPAPLTIQAPNVLTAPGFFTLTPLAGTQGCNSGSADVGETNADVFCPEFSLFVGQALHVSCASANVSASDGEIGDPCREYIPGGIYVTPGPAELLHFSLDPSSYALTLTGQLSAERQTLFTGNFVADYNGIYNTNYSLGVQTPSITSALMQPVSAPEATTPDLRSRSR